MSVNIIHAYDIIYAYDSLISVILIILVFINDNEYIFNLITDIFCCEKFNIIYLINYKKYFILWVYYNDKSLRRANDDISDKNILIFLYFD